MSFVVFDDEDALLIDVHAAATGMASVAVVPASTRLSSRNQSTMGGGDATDDGEAESAATAGGASSDERLLHALQLIVRDATATVGHDEFNSVIAKPGFQLDVFRARMAHGVVEQVVQRKHDRRAVGLNRRQRLGHRHVHLDTAIAEELAKTVHHLLDHLLRLERFEGIDVGHLGDTRVREQIVDEVPQPVGFLHQQLGVLALLLGRAHAAAHHRLADALNHRHRCLQLVRHGRDELGTHRRHRGGGARRANDDHQADAESQRAGREHQHRAPGAAKG